MQQECKIIDADAKFTLSSVILHKAIFNKTLFKVLGENILCCTAPIMLYFAAKS